MSDLATQAEIATLATETLEDHAVNAHPDDDLAQDTFDGRMRTRSPLLAAGILDLTRQLAEARAEIERLNARRFPIMGRPSIPWSLIAPHEGQAKINHGQTLDELAKRGGLAPNELWCVVAGQTLRQLAPEADAKVWLNGWLAAHDDAAAEREIERLRDCIGLQGSRASNAEQQLAEARAEIERLRAEIVDARRTSDKALDAEIRLHHEQLKRVITGHATDAAFHLEAVKALEEREHDMHMRIRAGYDRTVADAWRAEVHTLEDALREAIRIATDLNANMGDEEADAHLIRGMMLGGADLRAELVRMRATIAQPHMQWAAEQHSVGVDPSAEDVRIRAEADRMRLLWKHRFVIRHKLGMLLRDYPDDKQTKQIIAEIEGAIWLEEK